MAIQFQSNSSSNRFETQAAGAQLHPSGERTIAVWCQPNSVSQVWKVLTGQGGSDAASWSLEFYNGSMRYIVGGSNQYAGYGIPTGWNLVVIRGIPGSKDFTSQLWQPGVTGSPSRSTITRPPSGWAPDGILIAGDTYANPLGDVGVWDVTLTDAQAEALAAGAPFDSIDDEPIHYWPFYESDSTIEDSSGNNDMVLVGTAPDTVEHVYEPPDESGGDNINSYHEAVLIDSPVGYWPLGDPDNTSWAQDISGNALHGHYTAPLGSVLTDGPMPGSSAKIKNDDRAFIDFPATVVESPDGYSLEFWVKFNESQSGTNNYLLAESGPSAAGTTIRQSSGMSLNGWHKRANTTLGISSGTTASVGVWYHLVGVYNPADLLWRFYVNGNQIGNPISAADTFTMPSRFIRVGSGPHTTQSYTGVVFSHVAAYDYPLTPEQITSHYDSRVLSTPPPTALVVPNRYDDTDPKILFEKAWYPATHPSRYGGSAQYTDLVGARMTANFVGDTFRLICLTQADRGTASIKIDGVEYGPVDLHTSTSNFQSVVFAVYDLDDGPHQVVVTATGPGQADSSRVEIDAIEVHELLDPPEMPPRFEEDDPRVRLGNGYSTAVSASYSGGTGASTWSGWSTSYIKFSGPTVRVIGLRGIGRGSADFYIDGEFIERVSENYSLWVFDALIFEAYDLGPGEHLLMWTYPNGGGDGSGFTIDAFEVEELLDPGTRFEHDSPLITVSPGATEYSSTHYSGGSMVTLSDVESEYVSFWINGPSLRILSSRGTLYGEGELLIDGVLREEIDCYYPSATDWIQYPIVEINDLSEGPHYVQLRNKPGDTISFDAVEGDVIPAPLPDAGDFYFRYGSVWIEAQPLRHRLPDNSGWA